MNIVKYNNASEFVKASNAFLLENEIENALLIGLSEVAKTLENQSKNLYLTLEESGDVKLVVLMFGHNLVLSHLTTNHKNLCEALLDYLEKNSIKYPGIIGTRPSADYFMEIYNKTNEIKMTLHMNQRIYKLEKVNSLPISSGKLLLAKEEHIDLVEKWTIEMAEEVEEPIIGKGARKKARKAIENESIFLWTDNNEIVSMCKKTRPTKNTITIGLVYTPINKRKFGYASSVVSEVSKMLLKEYKYCSLYTDLDFNTSNKIYMDIGYVPVADSVVYEKEKDIEVC